MEDEVATAIRGFGSSAALSPFAKLGSTPLVSSKHLTRAAIRPRQRCSVADLSHWGGSRDEDDDEEDDDEDGGAACPLEVRCAMMVGSVRAGDRRRAVMELEVEAPPVVVVVEVRNSVSLMMRVAMGLNIVSSSIALASAVPMSIPTMCSMLLV